MIKRGRFIVLEGWEATGKSTQVKMLAEVLGAVATFQPGAARIGEQVRQIVLHTGHELNSRAEALLFAADKAQHVEEVIEPALASGKDVVCDRYTYSSISYQGAGRELGEAEVTWLSEFATGGLVPDLVVLLEVPEAVANDRLGKDLDLIESGDGEFHTRVRECFVKLAAADPSRWVRLDGSGAPQEVHERLLEVVSAHFGAGQP